MLLMLITGCTLAFEDKGGGETIPSAEECLEDTSSPDHVIGSGTPESCTPEAFIEAVAAGGIITFNTGNLPVTLVLPETAKIFNDTGPKIVIDGGGLVTLSGGGERRILYMNTSDPDQVWTTEHAQNQDHPQLTVQNLSFIDGDSSGEADYTGGGAIYVYGGRFKMVNCTFANNSTASSGPDVGGGGVRVFAQYNGLPVYVANCTFTFNRGSNGGALSSIGVSWTVINSVFRNNQALGNGGNPAQSGTPGGGSGGAIYNDGDSMTLTIVNSVIEENSVNAYGGAIIFVSNDHTGNIVIKDSVIRNNPGGSWYTQYPGISAHDDTPISVSNSVIEE